MTMMRTTSAVRKTTKMTRTSKLAYMMNRRLAALPLAFAFMLPLVITLTAPQARAQQGPVQRIVEGKVQNKSGAIVKGAVVYLKDTKTLAVKSYVSDDNGYFHFGQLSPNTDYDIWAELEGKRSKTKTISQFNSRQKFEYTLKIDE